VPLTKLQASGFCWAWPRPACFRELYSIYRGEFVAQRPLVACVKQLPSDVSALISWYKRSELGSRIAVIVSAATIALAFSVYITLGYGKLTDYIQCRSGGFLAAAIHNMDGIGGRPGWAWIFILEGLLTILVACASPWVIQDFPESAKFLSEAERTCTITPTIHMLAMLTAGTYVGVYVIRKLKGDMQFSADEEKLKLKYLWQCLTDWKTFVSRMSPLLFPT
jgi:MFS family permease